MYGVSEKPPFHRSKQELHPAKQTHPLGSMLEEHPSPPAVKPPYAYEPKKPNMIFSPNTFALEYDGNGHKSPLPPPPPPIPPPYGSDYIDPWEDFQPSEFPSEHKQKWFSNHQDFFRTPYGVPPKRANAHNPPSPYLGYQPYKGGYGLERLNSPRTSPNAPPSLWQRMDLTRQSAVKSSALRGRGNSAAMATTTRSLFAIFYTSLCLLILHLTS